MGKIKLGILLLLSGILLNACGQEIKKVHLPDDSLKRAWVQTIPGNFSSQSRAVFDSIEISAFLKRYPVFDVFANNIRDFYQKRHFAYAWYEKDNLIEQAGNLASRVMNIRDEGLAQSVPYQHVLDSLLYNTKEQPVIEVELMLTAQYFLFSKLAWDGMDNAASRSVNWYLPRKKVSYENYLDSLLKSPAMNEPVYRQYELLKRYLKKYRELDKVENWSPVTKTNTFKLGDSAEIIAQVKRRLYLLEDFQGDTTNQLFNEALVMAVKKFQSRHGLTANGKLDVPTFSELNVPLKNRIRQIVVNMERSRWLPVNLNEDYLAVNIPEFKLHVYHADSLLWSCDVVVGKILHETAVFYGEIKYIVFSPYWNVPASIVSKEIIPGIKKKSRLFVAAKYGDYRS